MSHTATGEWQSFEIRMRRRRAERLVSRADAAVAAGSLEEARASLEEAHTLWSSAPGLADVQQKLAEVRRQAEVPHKSDRPAVEARPPVQPRAAVEARADVEAPTALEVSAAVEASRDAEAARRSRWKERIAAGVSLAFAAGAVALLLVTLGIVQFPSSAVVLRAAPVLFRPAALPARDATSIVEAIPGRGHKAAASFVSAPDNVAQAPDLRPPIPDLQSTSELRLPFQTPDLRPATADLRSAVPDLRPPTVDPRSPVPNLRPSTSELTSSVPEPRSVVPDLRTPVSDPRPPITDLRSAVSDLPTVTTASAPASVQPPQEPLIRSALARYALAYTDLDVAAVERVWPSVNRSALTRAFESLALQRVSLGVCSIDVAGDSAHASCAGSATWTPKVGGGQRRDERAWSFDLEKSASGWLITSARVQNR